MEEGRGTSDGGGAREDRGIMIQVGSYDGAVEFNCC